MKRPSGKAMVSVISCQQFVILLSIDYKSVDVMQYAGGFLWLDGSNQGYFHWNDGEPSAESEQCVEMYMHNGWVHYWICLLICSTRACLY